MSTLKVGTIQDHANSNTAISIDSGGKVTLPQLVHFHGNRQTYSVEEVAGLVPFNTVRDSHSAWNNTNKQFTVPVTGVYHIGFLNIGDSTVDSSPQYHSFQFVRGGTTTTFAMVYTSNDAQYEHSGLSTTYHFQANDKIQLLNNSGAIYNNFYCTFSICLMG